MYVVGISDIRVGMRAKTLYAVVSGEYSYHRVHVLFESEEAAQAHADRRNLAVSTNGMADARVETYDLALEGEPAPKTFWHARWCGASYSDGEIRAWSNVYWDNEVDGDDYWARPVPDVPEVRVWGPPEDPTLYVDATGSSREAVLRAAGEAVARVKAEREGIGA